VDLGPERVVLADADVAAGVEARADLADEDAAGSHLLAAEYLHSAVLRLAVASVAGRALAFLVRHVFFLRDARLRADAGDLELGKGLAVTVLTTVALAAPDLEHDHLAVASLRHDLRAHLGAADEGPADRQLLSAEHQHFLEL